MKREFSEQDLWELRKQVTLNSLFSSDYENRFGLDPQAVQDFFDGYLDELDYIAQEEGEENLDSSELIDKYDNPENLKSWYDSYTEDPFGEDEPSPEDLEDADADFEGDDFMSDNKDFTRRREAQVNDYTKLEADAVKSDKSADAPSASIPTDQSKYGSSSSSGAKADSVFTKSGSDTKGNIEYSRSTFNHDTSKFKTDLDIKDLKPGTDDFGSESEPKFTKADLSADNAITEVKKILQDYQSMLDEDGDKGDDMYAAGMQAMIDAISDAVGGLGEFYQEAKRIMTGRLTEATGTEAVDRLYDIIDVLGYEEVLDNLIKWLPNDDIAEFADDITRDYDLDYSEDEEEEEEDDEEDNDEFDEDDFRPLWSK